MFEISDGRPQEVKKFVYPVSAKTGKGLGDLKNTIHDKLINEGFKTPFKKSVKYKI